MKNVEDSVPSISRLLAKINFVIGIWHWHSLKSRSYQEHYQEMDLWNFSGVRSHPIHPFVHELPGACHTF